MFCFISALWLAAACLHVSAAPPPPPPSSYPLSTTKVTTCDTLGNVHRLSCDEGVIVVQTALYGRLNRETCSEGWTNNLSDINCSQTGTTDVLKNSCNGKTTCEVATDAFHFSDPCHGTYKYLESTYTCVRTRQRPPQFILGSEISFSSIKGRVSSINSISSISSRLSSVVCEGSTAHLRCGQGQVIRVTSAVYGRQDTSTCSYRRPVAQLQNVNCVASATSQVAQMCNDQSSCSVTASNSVFGDPCGGTYKYLKITYTCNSDVVLIH